MLTEEQTIDEFCKNIGAERVYELALYTRDKYIEKIQEEKKLSEEQIREEQLNNPVYLGE